MKPQKKYGLLLVRSGAKLRLLKSEKTGSKPREKIFVEAMVVAESVASVIREELSEVSKSKGGVGD